MARSSSGPRPAPARGESSPPGCGRAATPGWLARRCAGASSSPADRAGRDRPARVAARPGRSPAPPRPARRASRVPPRAAGAWPPRWRRRAARSSGANPSPARESAARTRPAWPSSPPTGSHEHAHGDQRQRKQRRAPRQTGQQGSGHDAQRPDHQQGTLADAVDQVAGGDRGQQHADVHRGDDDAQLAAAKRPLRLDQRRERGHALVDERAAHLRGGSRAEHDPGSEIGAFHSVMVPGPLRVDEPRQRRNPSDLKQQPPSLLRPPRFT